MYIHIADSFTLLYSRNWHSSVKQLYPNKFFFKKWYKWIYLENGNRLTDIENKLMATKGEGEWGRDKTGVWDCCRRQVTSVMFDSVRPHRRQPTRLPHPCDSPGKSTGVGCHFLLQCMKVKSESEVTQSCPTLCDPIDCSLPGSSVHGIFQARTLEWGAIAFSEEFGINRYKLLYIK